MKKWGFGLAVLLLLTIYALGEHRTGSRPDAAGEKTPETDNPVQETPPAHHEAPKELTIRVTADQVHKGDLLLVNKDHPVPPGEPESAAVNLSQHRELLSGFGLLDNTVKLSPRLAQKFSTMVAAAENDGINHFLVTSGYRDNKKQNELYRQMGADYAMPAGYSEHNLGLSLDIGSSLAEMDQAPEGKWLKENAWNYGFILRYPKDKTAVTGILYEPWHFRYVGLPHSAVMQEKDMVLEEYLDDLKREKRITTTIDHQIYDIFYYSVSADTTIHVPATGRYDISGDNMGGVIVTVYSGADS